MNWFVENLRAMSMKGWFQIGMGILLIIMGYVEGSKDVLVIGTVLLILSVLTRGRCYGGTCGPTRNSRNNK